MSALELTLLVSAMARVDRRGEVALRMISTLGSGFVGGNLAFHGQSWPPTAGFRYETAQEDVHPLREPAPLQPADPGDHHARRRASRVAWPLRNAFAKLDFNFPKLCQALELCALRKLDKAIELGATYRRTQKMRPGIQRRPVKLRNGFASCRRRL